jgi:hypothetical protein
LRLVAALCGGLLEVEVFDLERGTCGFGEDVGAGAEELLPVSVCGESGRAAPAHPSVTIPKAVQRIRNR